MAVVSLSSPPAGTTTATAVLNSMNLSSYLATGNHLIIAVYNPLLSPDNYNGSSSQTNISIHQATTSVTVTTPPLSPAPVYGQAGVTFTATVTPEDGGDPTGAVTFLDGSKVLGTGTLSTTQIASGTNLEFSASSASG